MRLCIQITGKMSLEEIDTAPSDTLTLQSADFGCKVLEKLNSFRTENIFTDVILVAGCEEFACHRNVLAVSSPYFTALFSCALKESQQDVIDIKDVSAWTLRRVIDYAYTGRLEITVDNAQDMLAAGSLFQFQNIVDACCSFLSKHLHYTNCLGIEHFAHLHSCSELQRKAHEHVLDNFTTISELSEFLDLPMHRLQKYLSSDLIDVSREEVVYEAAVRWLKHGLPARRDNACTVFENVRFAMIAAQYMHDVILVEPMIANCVRCSQMIQEAIRCREQLSDADSATQAAVATGRHAPRPSTVARQVVVNVGGFCGNSTPTNTVDVYDAAKDKWCALPDMPCTLSWFSASVLHNDIYVLGGISVVDGRVVRSVWKYKTSAREWRRAPPMLTARARHSSAVANDTIYVLGGVRLSTDNKLVACESIESYSPETDAWSEVGQCAFPRNQSVLVPYKQTLVEIGGTRCDLAEDTMESFLCTVNSVVHSGEQFRLPETIQFAQVVCLDNVFYIMWENSKKFIMLDPTKRTFRDLAPMRCTHIHGGATVVGGKIYITGGLHDSTPSRVIECYDPEANTWSPVKSMPSVRACHGCVTIKMS